MSGFIGYDAAVGHAVDHPAVTSNGGLHMAVDHVARSVRVLGGQHLGLNLARAALSGPECRQSLLVTLGGLGFQVALPVEYRVCGPGMAAARLAQLLIESLPPV